MVLANSDEKQMKLGILKKIKYKKHRCFNSCKVFISKSAGALHTEKKVIGQPYNGQKISLYRLVNSYRKF